MSLIINWIKSNLTNPLNSHVMASIKSNMSLFKPCYWSIKKTREGIMYKIWNNCCCCCCCRCLCCWCSLPPSMPPWICWILSRLKVVKKFLNCKYLIMEFIITREFSMSCRKLLCLVRSGYNIYWLQLIKK